MLRLKKKTSFATGPILGADSQTPARFKSRLFSLLRGFRALKFFRLLSGVIKNDLPGRWSGVAVSSAKRLYGNNCFEALPNDARVFSRLGLFTSNLLILQREESCKKLTLPVNFNQLKTSTYKLLPELFLKR